MECFGTRISVFVLVAKVGQCNGDTLVEVCQFTQTVLQGFILVSGSGEDVTVWPESLSCTGTVAFAHFFHGVERLTARIFLLVYLSVTEHIGGHVSRKCVYAGYTHPVKTTRHLVRAFVKLTSGVEYGHNYFKCRFLFFFVIVYRNTTAVILYSNGIVFVDEYFNVVAVTGQGFVNRVVYNFINQVVQALFTDVANVHRRTLAYCFQSF